jgi:hypothetical protein
LFLFINSKKSSLDLQSEENELINHLGVYKSDSLNSFISTRSFDLIGRRKNSFGLLLKDELEDYEYKSLDDNN